MLPACRTPDVVPCMVPWSKDIYSKTHTKSVYESAFPIVSVWKWYSRYEQRQHRNLLVFP